MTGITSTLGFIGLGNIGKHFANNLYKFSQQLTVFDKAGTEARAPTGSRCAGSAAEVAAASEILFLSLPNGAIVLDVLRDIASTVESKPAIVVDLSTIGIEAAAEADALLRQQNIDYLDCPVSGGTAAAKAGTISLMCAGNKMAFDRCRPLFENIAKNIFYLGEKPGLGQGMKLANNFLSATSLAATSEAICFGQSVGLPMATMLEVLNASSGRNSATQDKFPNEVLTENFASGFFNDLMAKDIKLFRESSKAVHKDGPIGALINQLWNEFAKAAPGRDFTEIYLYVQEILGNEN